MAQLEAPSGVPEIFFKELLRSSSLLPQQVCPAVLITESGIPRELLCPIQIGRGKYFALSELGKAREIKLTEGSISLGLGRALPVYTDVSQAVGEAEQIALQHYVTGQVGNIWEYAEIKTDLDPFFARLSHEPLSVLPELINEAQKNMQAGIFQIGHCARLFQQILQRVQGELPPGLESSSPLYGALTTVFPKVENLLAYLHFAVQEQVSPPGEIQRIEMLHPVVEYLENNFTQSISVQDLSKRFSFNPSYISQLFRRELGMTFTEHLTDLRCQYACTLLLTTTLTLGEIAEKVGYNDYFYFIRVFKKTMGKTPSQYRNGSA
jgi:two-component system response regulator YesN